MKTPLFVSWLLALIFLAVADPATGQTTRKAAPPPVDPRVVELNIKRLTDADGQTRQAAAENLGRLGPQGRDAVPALVIMLEQGPEDMDRMAAAMALARLGSIAKPAVPALRKVAAETSHERLRLIAHLAAEAIEPPLTTKAWSFVSSTYGITAVVVATVGLLAFIVLLQRGRRAKEEEEKSQDSSKRHDHTTKPAAKPTPKPTPKPATAPVARPVIASQTARPGAAPDRSAKPRSRVSRPLPGHASYVQDQEGPESVKRDLNRAQEELKRISNMQKDLSGYLELDDVKRDPARLRELRKDIDEYGIEHYRAETRVKALEVKMLDVLLNNSKSTTQELRDRSETTLRQKWEELRTFCEAPSKIVWQNDHWVHVATGPKRAVADLRAHLLALDITLPEHLTAEADVDAVGPSTPTTPSAPEAPFELPPEPEQITSGPETIELMEANSDIPPEEIELIKAEARMAASEAIPADPPSNGAVSDPSASNADKVDDPASH